jgi:hypothetical protein
MVVILFIAAGVSAITAMRWAIQGKEVTVPALSGKSEARRQKFWQRTTWFCGSLARNTARFPPAESLNRFLPQARG